MGNKPWLQEGDKLLARTPVSLTNTLATTANGGQDYIHNGQTQENHENSNRTIVVPRVHRESATHIRTSQKHGAANYYSAHRRWLLSKQVSTRAVESESRSRKDFQPEESKSQKILTTPTPGRPFAHQL